MNETFQTASYKIIADSGGNRFSFFCDLSGALVCTTSPVRAADRHSALSAAWENEGRQHFNQCARCGRWVADVVFNPDTLCCVDCSPLEATPHYCKSCGAEIRSPSVFCSSCGRRLRYGEGEGA